MTKARTIIRNALTFGLNRLSPGEAEDADLFGRCLDALASIVDRMNGSEGLLWREIFTKSTPISGMTATLGVDWATLASGVEIQGATVQYAAGMDIPMSEITMEQYEQIPVKATASLPQVYAYDGNATVYFYPAAAGQTVTFRTLQQASNFADLDTDYVLPSGYQSAFEDFLAEKMAPTLNPSLLAVAKANAEASRLRIAANVIDPAILQGGHRMGNILTGWN